MIFFKSQIERDGKKGKEGKRPDASSKTRSSPSNHEFLCTNCGSLLTILQHWSNCFEKEKKKSVVFLLQVDC